MTAMLHCYTNYHQQDWDAYDSLKDIDSYSAYWKKVYSCQTTGWILATLQCSFSILALSHSALRKAKKGMLAVVFARVLK